SGASLGQFRVVEATSAYVIEGVTSARNRIAPLLSLAVWVEAPRDLRLQRGVQRDGVKCVISGSDSWSGKRRFSLRTALASGLISSSMGAPEHRVAHV